MNTLRASASNAVTDLRRVGVLHNSGLISLWRPDRIVATARAMRALGPVAGGVSTAAARTPDRIAIVDDAGAISYAELDARTDDLARGLLARGIDERSTIGAMCRDHRYLVETMVAAAKIGARLVLMNTGFSAIQLHDVAEREQVSVLVFDDEFAETIGGLPQGITTICTTEPAAHGDATLESVIAGAALSRKPLSPPRTQGGFVLLTGGTTGTPKGAPRKVESPLAAAQFLDRVPLRRDGVTLLCAPLFHGTALSQFILSLNLGCTVVLHGRFDARKALAHIAEHQATAVVLVPTMLRRILDLDPEVLAHFDTSSVRIIFTAGAALPTDLGNRAINAFGPVIYNFYGATEVGTATIATPADWMAAPGTVGKPPIGVHVCLYDEDGRAVHEPGAKGTIYVGNMIAFDGYSGGGTKKSVDGLLSTGDVGHWDESGHLFVDGRDDDMIVSGGENVFPGEVEDLLYAHPQIAEAAVIGVPDDEFGQRLAAFIVAAGEPIGADAIRAYVKANLARFKVPRDVVFLDELPRTPTGKIHRATLQAAELN